MNAKKTQPKYTSEQLEAISLRLQEMPEPKKEKAHSKQDAIKVLAKDITALQDKGYTIEQIAESLSGAGLDITTPTLRNYLARATAKKTVQRKRAPKKADTPAASPAQRVADQSKATFTPTPDSEEI